ncbi:FecCD family ABC transporter permease [Tuberibacillus sp. Marseille-P3662]|uniref:FecCD family ABC transporter permease n=1 Tax=Tuberibacillus sp. Marseille-P3662 TaxID=1965358 RepID=UPI000A1C8C46|nr:iron ABC transporter permease [Tuberibacillus sp. Marseille-P3662]
MQGVLTSQLTKTFVLIFSIILLLLSMVASIIFGLTDINLSMVFDAYTHYTGSNNQVIIRETRVPRALIATAIGSSLAISGALMQGITKNPLASPNILGVNAGASFFIVIAVTMFGVTSISAFTWLSFAGATVAALIVYIVGSLGNEISPVRLTLAGAAIAALFSSLTQGFLVLNEKALDAVLFWLIGSVQGRDLETLTAVLPYLVAGWILSIVISSKMNVLILGEKVAKSLGQNILITKMIVGLIVILLAGGSVAVAGPIGFIGIVIPHIAKWLVGQDYRWLIPYSALLGAILLLLADITARYVIMPSEVPVGIMTAVIGTPFFVYIARKGVFKT